MKKLLVLPFLVLAACSKPAASSSGPTASPSASTPLAVDSPVATIEDGGATPPPAAWTKCEIPKALVQLGTVKERATFVGNLLVSDASVYDPETVKPLKIAKPKAPVDGPHPSGKYADVEGQRGVIVDEATPGATVENTTTHAPILKLTENCAAGGAMDYLLSHTGRFLICASSREGETLWDLSAPKPDPKKPVVFDKNDTSDAGIRLAPNDTYGVLVPVIAFGTNVITRPAIAFTKLDGKAPVAVTPATLSTDENAKNDPFTVAFCGDGAIFATAGDKELGVYKGTDGSKITSAPSLRGGDVSFSASGHYLSQTRGNATTVYKLQ